MHFLGRYRTASSRTAELAESRRWQNETYNDVGQQAYGIQDYRGGYRGDRLLAPPPELNNSITISVGVGIDADGQKWYAVGSENEFTNCEFRDLKSVDDWYESGWIEREK